MPLEALIKTVSPSLMYAERFSSKSALLGKYNVLHPPSIAASAMSFERFPIHTSMSTFQTAACPTYLCNSFEFSPNSNISPKIATFLPLACDKTLIEAFIDIGFAL